MAHGTAPRGQETANGWLFGQAVPLWLEHGVDRDRGGFHDALDPHSLTNCAPFKRLRVTTRQIYVFAEAALHGVAGAQSAAEHGLDFLLTMLRHPEGGFASKCDRDGHVVDGTRDLYDLAFTLFALAHAHRLSAKPALQNEALELLGFIQSRLRHPAGGYAEALPSRGPRRQNPHMHLLEAALACAEHMPHPAFDALCDELADLAVTHFIDAEAGLLFEYYSEELIPLRKGGRALVEPGHQFEWAWLLTEVERVRGRTISGAAALAEFALVHGRDPVTALLRGELHDDGGVAAAAVRLWPHCEWLKAALVLNGAAGAPDDALVAMMRFLAAPTAGLWFERWDGETGAFVEGPVPASSLYHLTTAFMALERHGR